MMKKLNFVLLTSFGILSMTGCDTSWLNESSTIAPLAFDCVYDYSAISGIQLLAPTQGSTKMARKMQHQNEQETQGDEKQEALTDEQKQDLIIKLEMVEEMLTNSIFKSEVLPSDKEEYETMYTLTTKNFNDIEQTYVFYYNETLKENEHEQEHKENKNHHDEQESRLEGIVIFNELEYQMIGEKEIKDDEVEMKFKVSLDEQNYVVINQETESDEQEFEYIQYVDGKKVYQTEIEFEANDKKGKFEVEFKEKSENGIIAYQYEFKIEEERKFVEIKIKENKTELKVKMEIFFDENNQPQYIFLK